MNKLTLILAIVVVSATIATFIVIGNIIKIPTNKTTNIKSKYTQNITVTLEQKIPKPIINILKRGADIEQVNSAGSYIIRTTTGQVYIIYNMTRPTLSNYLHLLEIYTRTIYNMNRSLYMEILRKADTPTCYSLVDLVVFNNGTAIPLTKIVTTKMGIRINMSVTNITNNSALVCIKFISKNNRNYIIKYGLLTVVISKFFIPVAARTYLLLNLNINKTYCIKVFPQYNFTRLIWQNNTIVSENDIKKDYAVYIVSVSYIPEEEK